MADEIPTTVILNPRPIEAPEPPKPGVMGAPSGKGLAKAETDIEKILRRLAALEKAVNGRVSE